MVNLTITIAKNVLLIKKIFYLILFLSFNLIINGQNSASSLNYLHLKDYDELADLFYNNKPDTLKAITYANAYFSKALKEKDTIEMLDGKYFLADIKNNEDIYLNYCDSLINLTRKNPNKNFPAAIHLTKSDFFFNKRDNIASLKELVFINKCLKKNKNDSLKILAAIRLATIKSSVGDDKESLTLYKEAYNYANEKKYLKNDNFSTLPLNISLTYKAMNKIDSAYLYNNIAINLYKEKNDSISLGYSFYVLGALQEKKKEYQKSIKSFTKAIPSIIDDENFGTLTRLYTKIGTLFDSINDKKNTLKYHLKADSLNISKNIPSPSLAKTYQFLYNYNKEVSNLEKQLFYINKLLKIREYYLNEKNKINRIFTKEYDIPYLLSERKFIINTLKNKVERSKRNKLIYLSLIFITVLLIVYQFRKRNIYKKRFLNLVNQKRAAYQESLTSLNTKNTVTNKHSISNNIITSILKELDFFEKEKGFLNSDNSLQSLANKVNTNTNYLSKIINQHKNTTFSNYINKLRIDYIVERLKTDSLLRKYTIKTIANEAGFKNTESFSKAFYKFTEIKPSYFIKELEKTNTKH